MRAFTDTDRAAMADPVFAERYRHTSDHDAHLDGHFVVGWPMSETFCCPGCSSRTPRPSRVRFYRTAAAAFAAGLHPCPRCRPDLVVAAPTLSAGDSVAARAMRLIDDGELDRHGAVGVARCVGVSPRQVLRAVQPVADCGPLDLARARRGRLARILLTTTMAPMQEVATAAGFTTVRQFNATIRSLYRVTPGVIRFGPRPAHAAPAPAGPLTVRSILALPGPVPQAWMTTLADRAVPEVEEGSNHWYARTVRLPHGAGRMRVDLDASGHVLATLTVADPRDFAPLLARTERLFATADAPRARDRAVPQATDPAEDLIRTVVEHHAPPTTARTILGGLTAALGEATAWGRVFPAAAAIAREGHAVLRGPKERTSAILRAAQLIADGEIDVGGGWTTAALIDRHRVRLGI